MNSQHEDTNIELVTTRDNPYGQMTGAPSFLHILLHCTFMLASITFYFTQGYYNSININYLSIRVSVLNIVDIFSSITFITFSEPGMHGDVHDSDAEHGRRVQRQALRLPQPEGMCRQGQGQKADLAHFPGKSKI